MRLRAAVNRVPDTLSFDLALAAGVAAAFLYVMLPLMDELHRGIQKFGGALPGPTQWVYDNATALWPWRAALGVPVAVAVALEIRFGAAPALLRLLFRLFLVAFLFGVIVAVFLPNISIAGNIR
jgi:hypothetical protein